MLNLTNLTVTVPAIMGNSTIADAGSLSLHIFEQILPYILIVLCLSTLVSNSIVLAAFIKNRNLRTPFNMYLISLILADLAQALFDMPFSIIHQFAGVWPLGRIGCNFYLYGKWIGSAAVRNTHALISLNRIWALFLPISYQRYHTKAMAVWLCVGSWVYVHIFLLPGLVLDDLIYRIDDGSCWVNTTAQTQWAIPTQFVVYNSSVFIVGITYPIIWWKVKERRKILPTGKFLGNKQRDAISGSASAGNATVGANNKSDTQPCRNQRLAQVARTGMGSTEPSQQTNDATTLPHNSGIPSKPLTKRQIQERSSQSFAVLTYLVIGVVVCWSPIMIYFTMVIVSDYDSYLHFVLGSLLYYTNSLLDPLFFTLAVVPLRVTIYRMFDRLRQRTTMGDSQSRTGQDFHSLH